jgi:hypothetical protein
LQAALEHVGGFLVAVGVAQQARFGQQQLQLLTIVGRFGLGLFQRLAGAFDVGLAGQQLGAADLDVDVAFATRFSLVQ